MNLEVVILAAGQGTRMKSRMPKVLHRLAGKPLVIHVIESAFKLKASVIHIVVGHGGEMVKQQLAQQDVKWITQDKQLGTGHAVAQALPALQEDSNVLILYGDVPLTSVDTLNELLLQSGEKSIGLLTVCLKNPHGYGRIIRNAEGAVQRIVEEKDANEEQRMVREANTGILAVPSKRLKQWLPKLSSDNSQGEYYLTDIISMAVEDGLVVNAVKATTEEEVRGINSRQQLAEMERWYQRQLANRLMAGGVTLADPDRIDIRGQMSAGQDTCIDVNTVFEGVVEIGDNVNIGPNVVIKNSKIADNVSICANCIIEDSQVSPHCQVGPFARLRPGTFLGAEAKVGNFVEIKKANIGTGSKVNHLSYVGDAEIGEAVNIGAGTITCNYDGVNKHLTRIEDGVFVGSNTALVAPITVGKNATIGAGSTVSQNVQENSLVVTRGEKRSIKNWERPKKRATISNKTD